MKNYLVILLVVFFVDLFSQNEFQRYNVASGRVVYKTENNKETINKIVVFKDWGAIELIEEETIEYTNKNKTTVLSKKVEIVKLDKGFIYTVNENEKQIYQAKNYLLIWQKDKNLTEEGKVIAEDFGGAKIGEETYLGYLCEVWRIKGENIINYKGVTMAIDSKYNPEKAIEATFDIQLADELFQLPDYPIININPFAPVEESIDYLESEEGQQEMKEVWDDVKDLTWEEWYYIYHSHEVFEGMTKEEIKEEWEQQKSKSINERIDDRIEERKEDHLKNIPHWPTW